MMTPSPAPPPPADAAGTVHGRPAPPLHAHFPDRPPFWFALAASVAGVALMYVVRVELFPDRIVPLAYGLPLLLCLWARDLRLLHGTAIALSLLSVYKVVWVVPRAGGVLAAEDWVGLPMMLVSIWLTAGVLHGLLVAVARAQRSNASLERSNAELEAVNAELATHEAEVARQNEELQAQAESLRSQTAEMEQQAEELRQQAEAMAHQTAELQQLNEELGRHERGLQTLLESARWLRGEAGEADAMAAVCHAAVQVMDAGVRAAAVVREQDGRLVTVGHHGFGPKPGGATHDVPPDRSFTALVIEKGQTAYLKDVALRPDLDLPTPGVGKPFRSVLASPIWVEGRAIGAVEVFSPDVREWTEDEFRVIEWLAAQSALALQAIASQREQEVRRREAEEAAAQKARFLAAVSHDVRTPVNAISLMADLIEQTANDPGHANELPELARDLKANARSLVELVSDVLDLSRFDAGIRDLQTSEFAVCAMVRAELRQFVPLAKSKGIELAASIAEDDVWVRTDRMKLARVLANLVGNAIKFTDVGSVAVACEPSADGGAELHVTDTGPGIPPEHLPRIFDEFFQLRNPERDRNKGTGLGLAICRRLIDAIGCSIAVRSTPGRGTTFTVKLPAELVVRPPEARGAAASAESCATDGPGDGLPLRGARVLLVEDHEPTRAATAQLLAARGAIVIQAATGRAAMHVLSHELPSVVLLDLMLPDVDGAEVLRHLQRHRPPSLQCVLAVSGDVRPARTEEVRRLGADGLVAKPLSIDSLVEAIRAQLNRRDPTTPRDSITPTSIELH